MQRESIHGNRSKRFIVIPTKVGIQCPYHGKTLDPRLRGDDIKKRKVLMTISLFATHWMREADSVLHFLSGNDRAGDVLTL